MSRGGSLHLAAIQPNDFFFADFHADIRAA